MGKWIHAVSFMSIMFVVLFFSPGSDFPPTLDTSMLDEIQTEVNNEGGMVKAMENDLQTTYEAPSIEVALKALPYKLHLPEDLPFEAEEFKVMEILDWNEKDGEEIKISLITIPKDKDQKGWIMINADDQRNVIQSLGSTEPVVLSKNIKAEFKTDPTNKSSFILWTLDGVRYSINYMYEGEKYDKDTHKMVLISLASQIIENQK